MEVRRAALLDFHNPCIRRFIPARAPAASQAVNVAFHLVAWREVPVGEQRSCNPIALRVAERERGASARGRRLVLDFPAWWDFGPVRIVARNKSNVSASAVNRHARGAGAVHVQPFIVWHWD
jgi:hypothetical protein